MYYIILSYTILEHAILDSLIIVITIMATTTSRVPKVLILGHSFVRRLKHDLRARFDERTLSNFALDGTAEVHMHGVGGRTVQKLGMYDLGVVSRLSPESVILEIGTNDLSLAQPEVVDSSIDDLVRHLLDHYSVRVVVLCHVTPRAHNRKPYFSATKFNENAAILNQYTRVVIDDCSQVISTYHLTTIVKDDARILVQRPTEVWLTQHSRLSYQTGFMPNTTEPGTVGYYPRRALAAFAMPKQNAGCNPKQPCP